ncbi:MAG: RNA polymerase-binding protein DksA [Deltaproteobacteria bacterium]|nr:RNA polymerase-binding protein DksA [Deltaproteobacteria bacterium]
MEERDQKYLKNLMECWLNELLTQANMTVETLRETGDHLSDPLDRAVYESNRGTTLRIRDRESRLINKIMGSLEDIENEAYGICEECGKEIAFERLKARPVARRCIDCKAAQENLERRLMFR